MSRWTGIVEIWASGHDYINIVIRKAFVGLNHQRTQRMALIFPHLSRWYDTSRKGVCFWGYDQTFEISFFVEQNALSKIDAGGPAGEVEYLNTFDANRERICHAATTAYSKRLETSRAYSFTPTDVDL